MPASITPPQLLPNNFCPETMATVKTCNWMFTINNPTEGDSPLLWADVKYLCYQKEKGEKEGTEHYQGYVIFNKSQRRSALKKINARAHWEPRNGTHDQAVAYCTKAETRLSEPVIRGEPPAQGKRTDLKGLIESAQAGASEKELIESDPETWARNYRALERIRFLYQKPRSWKTEVMVLYGPTGTGKSHRAHEAAGTDAYVKTTPSKWFDGYEGQEDVIFDDFTGNWVPFHQLLTLLDKWPCTVEKKGSYAQWVPKRLIITSNHHPKDWYPCQQDLYDALERRIDTILHVTSQDEYTVIKGHST